MWIACSKRWRNRLPRSARRFGKARAAPEARAMYDLSPFVVADERSTGCPRELGRDWIVCQIGAREHYALAAELHRRGRLRGLCTDIWANEGSVWRAVAALAPSQGRKIWERYEPSLRDARVVTMEPIEMMGRMVRERLGSRSFVSWTRLMKADRRFAGAISRRLERSELLRPSDGLAPVVFAYSYGAREILSVAKRSGCFTVLGQIDPGPDDELIDEVTRRHGVKRRTVAGAPAAYWSSWRDECALADLILVNSEWSASLVERAGVARDKLRISPLAFRASTVHHPTEERAFPPCFTEERPLRLLFLGKANIRKGALELLQAMARLQDAPARLLMVGHVEDDVREFSRHMNNVEWVGPVARSATAEFYRRADVFILPTHSDGFAITQLEALAHDLPVIVSRNCGDVIEHGRQGLRLEQVTAEAIEGAVRNVLAHPEALAAMSARAAARLAHFSPERVVDALVAAVEEACA
jgi:glycosyltransferase involved in cell wall biosynthesis